MGPVERDFDTVAEDLVLEHSLAVLAKALLSG